MPSKSFLEKATPETPKTPIDDYRQRDFEVLDFVTGCIQDRFDQEDYQMYATCEQLLVKAARKEVYSSELASFTSFYGDDFNSEVLNIQLKTLSSVILDTHVKTFHDTRCHVNELSVGVKVIGSH